MEQERQPGAEEGAQRKLGRMLTFKIQLLKPSYSPVNASPFLGFHTFVIGCHRRCHPPRSIHTGIGIAFVPVEVLHQERVWERQPSAEERMWRRFGPGVNLNN